ncbi:hypothetical protein IW261DRAFT_587044 [Armillaria novae-zelandiae]|uniref:Uncharacterized protein n=1 Tax=Armillaria novae-zelandiae TaxID=153914 RepID=A0AA39UH09_9AGAR|nr:hypothetical protein IW261DRAFT_587044 [Armillaria novae-zelandiae]
MIRLRAPQRQSVGKLHHQMNLLLGLYLEKTRLFGFEDGSIVLISDQRTGFRVHLNVLSLNAEYFRDVSGLAQPGCTRCKRRHDDRFGGFNDSLSARFVHSLLLLRRDPNIPSNPYYACLPNNLAQQDVVQHLSMVYPSEELADLEKHSDLILPRSDLHSLRAGREYDVPIIILPAAYYDASTLPTTELITNAKPDILAIILAGREKRRRCCVQRCVVLDLPGVAVDQPCVCCTSSGAIEYV